MTQQICKSDWALSLLSKKNSFFQLCLTLDYIIITNSSVLACYKIYKTTVKKTKKNY